MDERFDFEGPEDLREGVTAALRRVIDPEVALNIVDVGLVYRVCIDDRSAQVRLTMTSAACPMADVIIGDLVDELQDVLPQQLPLDVELVWEPPWTPERLSESARRFMGW